MQEQHGPGLSQKSRVQAVKMSYLRSAFGVSRMDGMSSESVYEHFGMCHVGEGKKCGVVEGVKRDVEVVWPRGANGGGEDDQEGVCEIEGGNVTGRPPVKWRDRVQEYVRERERGEGSLRNPEQARRECQDRERWKLFCCGHPLVGAPRRRHQNELN